MINSIYIAMSGLNGYEQGLRTIADNTANINTPGYKSSSQPFANMVAGGNGSGTGQVGYGLQTLGPVLNFQQGQLQTTGNDLDLAIDGQGLFTLKAADGSLRYTRDGQFKFNTDGVLVSSTTGEEVLGMDENGLVGPITITNFKVNTAKATATVNFSGNLSTAVNTHTITGVTVFDAAGTSYTMSVKLDKVVGSPNNWTVTLQDSTGAAVGTPGTIAFINGVPDPANSKVAVTYTPPNQAAVALSLDFSTNVTSSGTSTFSSLAMATQDGYAPGGLTRATFDATGVLVLTYSNGQTVKGSRLLLGSFNSVDAIASAGDNEFEVKDGRAWQSGTAGALGFGSVRAGMVEMSNVDLSQQFSELVIMQRGYQASSQIISTANDMLTELFGITK